MSKAYLGKLHQKRGLVKTVAHKLHQHLKNAPYNQGKYTIPRTLGGRAVLGGSLGLLAGDGAYRIAKAWIGARKEAKDHIKGSMRRGDELIAAARTQRKDAAFKLKQLPKKKPKAGMPGGGQGGRNFNYQAWD